MSSEEFAEINGIKICYEVKGEGEPLILVHGFGAKKEEWIAQFDALAQYFKVYRFDNRGAGKSDRPNMVYTMETFTDDIKALMEYWDLKKANIAGWSLGGMIVQNFALKYPKKVNKLILINTNHKGQGGELYAKMRHQSLEVLKEDPEKYFWQSARNSFHRTFRKEMEKNPQKKFHEIWSVEEKIKQSAINPSTHEDIDNQAKALETHDTLSHLDQITAPTLLLAASHDRLTPLSCMKEIHEEISNSTLKIIEKAGHGSPLSRAPEINQAIIEFLQK